jgi:hypothetical protein
MIILRTMNKLVLIVVTFFSLGGSQDLSAVIFNTITENNTDELQGYKSHDLYMVTISIITKNNTNELLGYKTRIDDDINCNYKVNIVTKIIIFLSCIYFTVIVMTCIYLGTENGLERFEDGIIKYLINDRLFWFACFISMFLCYGVIQSVKQDTIRNLPKHVLKIGYKTKYVIYFIVE